MKDKRKYVTLAGIGSVVILVDQITKLMVLKRFALHESVHYIPDFFAFTYVRNKGAAFSLLNSAPDSVREPFFAIVPFIILAGLCYYFYTLTWDRKLTISAVSLIIGGAIGNIIDRLRLGYVVDFIHFHWKDVYHYPMFNVADSCIVIGVGLLLIEMLITKDEKKDAKGA